MKWFRHRDDGWMEFHILLLSESIRRARNNIEKLLPFTVHRSFFIAASLPIVYCVSCESVDCWRIEEMNTFSNSMHDKFEMSFNYAQIENHKFFFLPNGWWKTIYCHSSLNYELWMSKKNRRRIQREGKKAELKLSAFKAVFSSLFSRTNFHTVLE